MSEEEITVRKAEELIELLSKVLLTPDEAFHIVKCPLHMSIFITYINKSTIEIEVEEYHIVGEKVRSVKKTLHTSPHYIFIGGCDSASTIDLYNGRATLGITGDKFVIEKEKHKVYELTISTTD